MLAGAEDRVPDWCRRFIVHCKTTWTLIRAVTTPQRCTRASRTPRRCRDAAGPWPRPSATLVDRPCIGEVAGTGYRAAGAARATARGRRVADTGGRRRAPRQAVSPAQGSCQNTSRVPPRTGAAGKAPRPRGRAVLTGASRIDALMQRRRCAQQRPSRPSRAHNPRRPLLTQPQMVGDVGQVMGRDVAAAQGARQGAAAAGLEQGHG